MIGLLANHGPVRFANRIEGLLAFDGAAGKTPFVAAVEARPLGKPHKRKLSRVEGFSAKAISGFASRHLDPGSLVISDGLRAFVGVTEAGCDHRAIRAGSGKAAAQDSAFTRRWLLPSLASRSAPLACWRGWVSTALGHIKAAIGGTYHSVSSRHVPRYLAEF